MNALAVPTTGDRVFDIAVDSLCKNHATCLEYVEPLSVHS